MAEEIELRPQLFWNYLDLTHHALRCGLPEKPYIDKLIIFIERAERFYRDEKLRYYRMSSRIVEAVTEEKFAGFYEMPLFSYYKDMAVLYFRSGDTENGEKHFRKICDALHRQITEEGRADRTEFAEDPTPKGYTAYWKTGMNLQTEGKIILKNQLSQMARINFPPNNRKSDVLSYIAAFI